jgi:hypothetical protein
MTEFEELEDLAAQQAAHQLELERREEEEWLLWVRKPQKPWYWWQDKDARWIMKQLRKR